MNIVEAKLALAESEATEKKAQRKKWLGQLADVRRLIRERKDEYYALRDRVKAYDYERSEILAILKRYREQESELLAQFDFDQTLATDLAEAGDADAKEWVAELAKIRAAIDKQQALLRNLASPDRAYCGSFEGPMGIIAQLQWQERSFVNLLRGTKPGAWLEGSVGPV